METHEMEHAGTTYTILVGKNAKSNDQLLDQAGPSDVWFHVDDAPSGHVFLVNEKEVSIKKIPKQVIKRCACLCKASTKASGKCNIIYTMRKHIEKTDVLGCVIPSNLKSVSI
jgi:predicted ribosome quality control (RQC) complex YloA/Tae2 family protein